MHEDPVSRAPAEPGPANATRHVTTSGVLRVRRQEELYREISLRFFVLLKTAQISSAEEEEFLDALWAFRDSLDECLQRESSLVIGERDGYLYLNAVRTRVDADAFAIQRFLVETLAKHDFAGILFQRGVADDEICAFLDVLLRAGRPGGRESFAELGGGRIRNIQPILRWQTTPDHSGAETPPDEPVQAAPEGRYFGRRTYFKSIFVLRHLLDGVGRSSCLDLREAKQIVQTMVEHLLEDDDARIALDLIREWDHPYFLQSVKVSALAFALGRRMGLSGRLLGDLAVAALFRDLGAIDAVREAFPQVEEEPAASFRRLIAKGVTSDMMLRAALVAWELRFPGPAEHDGTAGVADGSLLTRIVRAAERFEQLVGPEESGGRALPPSAALDVLRGGGTVDAGIFSVLEAIIHEDAVAL